MLLMCLLVLLLQLLLMRRLLLLRLRVMVRLRLRVSMSMRVRLLLLLVRVRIVVHRRLFGRRCLGRRLLLRILARSVLGRAGSMTRLLLLLLLLTLLLLLRLLLSGRRWPWGSAVAIVVGRVKNRPEIHGCWAFVTRSCVVLRETMDGTGRWAQLSSIQSRALVRLEERRQGFVGAGDF